MTTSMESGSTGSVKKFYRSAERRFVYIFEKNLARFRKTREFAGLFTLQYLEPLHFDGKNLTRHHFSFVV